MTAIQRIRIRAVVLGIALVLVGCAVVYLSLAAYLYLAYTMPAYQAALVTGIALLGVTIAAVGITWWATSRRRRRRRHRPAAPESLEELLGARMDPILRDWIGRHPEGAAAGTLLLGIAAGYSRSVRRVLRDLLDEFTESERRRREHRGP